MILELFALIEFFIILLIIAVYISSKFCFSEYALPVIIMTPLYCLLAVAFATCK